MNNTKMRLTFMFGILLLKITTNYANDQEGLEFFNGGIETDNNGNNNLRSRKTTTLSVDDIDHRNLKKKRTRSKIENPCILMAQADNILPTPDSAATNEDEYFCCLQKTDSARFGPRCLHIDGLDLQWVNSTNTEPSNNNQKLKSGISTIFMRNAKIMGSQLKLPKGKTINDAALEFDGEGKDDTSDDGDNIFDTTRRLATPTGTKQTLVIRVETANVDTTNSITQITNELFVNSPSFSSQYKAMSYNQIEFVPATSVGTYTGPLINGGYTVDISPFSIVDGVTTRDDVATEIETKLTSVFGANWEDTIDIYMYVLPSGTVSSSGDPWIAVASVNLKRSMYSDTEVFTNAVVMHEIGHNLNLDHSGDLAAEEFSDNQYDDNSCIMGGALGTQEQIHFNGPKSYQLGWYSSKTLDLTSGTNWEGKICGVVDFQDNTVDYVVIRIIDATSTVDDHYVAFNRKASFNIQTKEGENKVLVTKQSVVDYSKSWLEAELDESNSVHFVPSFGGVDGLTIIVTEIDLYSDPACATVAILFSSLSPTMSSSPTTTLAPTKVPGINVYPDGTTPAKSIRFDVVAVNELCITGFRLHLNSNTYTVNIYTKDTSIESNLNDSLFDNWVLVQTATVTGQGQGSETDLPLLSSQICIQAGATQAFRIDTSPSVYDMLFTEKSTSGVRDSDGNLEIYGGWIRDNTNYKAYYDFEGTIKYIIPQDNSPSTSPSNGPTMSPSKSAIPSYTPSISPSKSVNPSSSPSLSPSKSADPSIMPSTSPSKSADPSSMPSIAPSKSTDPSSVPSFSPSKSSNPSSAPSLRPSNSANPSSVPSSPPSKSAYPSIAPSLLPSKSANPSISPSLTPSKSAIPTNDATPSPSRSLDPSESPTKSLDPSMMPSMSPSKSAYPSTMPSFSPSKSAHPSTTPSFSPSKSADPSVMPSFSPSKSADPSIMPSDVPSKSLDPSVMPSDSPSKSVDPSIMPSASPSKSVDPSIMPSIGPSKSFDPSISPSMSPSKSSVPSISPSMSPSKSANPSATSSMSPSTSSDPSIMPSMSPSSSLDPSMTPSIPPSTSAEPSNSPSISTDPSFVPTILSNFTSSPASTSSDEDSGSDYDSYHDSYHDSYYDSYHDSYHDSSDD